MHESQNSSSSVIKNQKPKKKNHVANTRVINRSLSVELSHVFSLEEIKNEVRCWKLFQNYLRNRSHVAVKSNSNNNPIWGLCLAEPKEQKWLIKFRKVGFNRLNHLLQSSTRKEAQSKDIKLLTWCCLNLLSFYYSKSQNQIDDCNCRKMRKFDQSKALFRGTMYLILPEKQIEVIRQTIRYMTITGQWNTEDYDSFVFQELLTMITKPEILLAKIIKQIETSQREMAMKEAFNISCTLSTILEEVYWDKYLFNHLLHNCFNTLLKLYLLCSYVMPSNYTVENVKFRVVIKTCIKYFISNIKDNKGLVSVMDSTAKCLHDRTIINEDRVDVTEVIAYCAQRHFSKYFRESITPDLLDLLLQNLITADKSVVMLSHKIFQHLFDRHNNAKFFAEPVYFFKGRSEFTINYDFGMEDIHFFKSFSSKFFEGIKVCFIKFSEKHDLFSFYCTLCLVLVEIPDPVITINVIHVIISTQNETLKNGNNYSMTEKAHLNAITAAIMSLICIIHKEEVAPLEKYVDKVVRFRSENSPHLLPPLQNKYTVASHHTTEYHEQLYFLEEEILYALQRCWLAKRSMGLKL